MNAKLFAASDHSPIIIKLFNCIPRRRRPVRFEAAWLHENACSQVVADAWKHDFQGSFAFVVTSKNDWVMKALRKWNHEVFDSIPANIKKLQDALQDVQCKLQYSVSMDLVMEERKIRLDLESWLEKEHLLWAQKSRQMWLLNGDRKTSYFHKVVKRRRAANRILKLQNEQGRWIENYEDIEVMAVKYFQNLYFMDEVVCPSTIDQWLVDIQLPRIIDAHREDLLKPVSDLEIFEALKQMEAFNSPGPDGLPLVFSNISGLL